MPKPFPTFPGLILVLVLLAACQPVALSEPTPTPIITPLPGDLGWGTIHGKIVDAATGAPIVAAKISCSHYSYSSPAPCRGSTLTDQEGEYTFPDVYFHDTDNITLKVEAAGYQPLEFKQAFFTLPDFHADLQLSPLP